MSNPRGYCATCNNTGVIDCHCGGDLCVCDQPEIECPDCGSGWMDDEDDGFTEEGYDAGEWNNTPPNSVVVINIDDDESTALDTSRNPPERG